MRSSRCTLTFWRALALLPCCPAAKRLPSPRNSALTVPSLTGALSTPSARSAEPRTCQHCGRMPRRRRRRRPLTRFPCGHRLCSRCSERIVDDGFRDIEGLDCTPCPRCKTLRLRS